MLRTMLLFMILTLLALFSPTAILADEHPLSAIPLRNIGPALTSGRVSDFAFVPGQFQSFYVSMASGGVWKTENNGITWQPVFDNEGSFAIGVVELDPSNPNIVWVGSGENNAQRSVGYGDGVYKSIDGGKNWKLMGLANSERINRIALHPNNPDIAYVAAMGTLWGPNEERGVYKTTDGGKSWQRILYVNDTTGATDIKIDTLNPDKLFASMWQFRRWPYQFESGGEGSGMYITHDGGKSWQQKTEEDGLPTGELGRMSFAVSAANPERVYALVEANKSALLRSDDGGDNWNKVNEEYNVADRPFYYSEIAADPQNADIVYNIATRVRVSIDGGKNFTYNPVINCCGTGNTIHIDNHAYWINPNNSNHLIIGNDGGLAITHDKGETFRYVRNLPLAQFYHIAVDNDHPYNIYGGLQDNGSWRGPAEVWSNGGILNLHWQEVGFGDGFDTLPDPDNSRSGYGMFQGGNLYRWNLDTGEQKLIMPNPPTAETELRFSWNAALAIDPFDANTVYYGSQFVHRSHDRGLTWETISDDLSSNDPDMQTFKTSGGLTSDVTAAENYTTISAIAPSKLQREVIWAGTDDGRVHVSQDGGQSWSRIDGKARGMEAGAWVAMIAPSAHDAGSAFVVFDDHRRSNMQPYVYRIENYGSRWSRLSTDGMSGYALSVLQDSVDPDLLFVGTEFGLHVSTNGGESWTKFTAGVPTVSVMDMAIQERENDLVLGTHGRAAYVIDDYSGLRNLSAKDFDTRLKVLSASPGQQYTSNQAPSSRFTGSGEFRADNEAYGVMLTFMASGDDLPHPDEDTEKKRKIKMRNAEKATTDDSDDKKDSKAPKLSVTVKNANGEVIRSYKTDAHQGINRLIWGMQADGIKPVMDNSKDDDDSLPPGPTVLPGNYEITLTLGDATASTAVEVLKDPRSVYSTQELAANYDTRVRMTAMRDTANSALRQIIAAQGDVATINKLIATQLKVEKTDELEALKEQATEVTKGLKKLEKLYRAPEKTKGITYTADTVNSKINSASFHAYSGDGATSPTSLVYIDIAKTALEDATNKVNAFMAEDLAGLRENVDNAGITLLKAGERIEMPE